MNDWFQALPVAMTWTDWVSQALAADPSHPKTGLHPLPRWLPDFGGAARIVGRRWLVWR